MFNRQEQLVLLFMGAALLAGSGTALVDHYRPASLEEFQVIPEAAPAPPVPAGPVTGPPAAPAAGPVQLNSATAAQLLQLPGIGPKTAARILSYRQEHGSFKTIADLVQVPGIGPRTLERLRTLVVVE
ncbi:MAG: helix-hairpin-helix domain-containing protein [Candidatus Latescibacteria bacterium]|nr:helix-hairpin-helix domain-containing protein [Candidatus Latescibacterota bacterium]